MVRTQISLTQLQAQRLRYLAQRRGVSMASLLRAAVDELTGGSDDEGRSHQRALACVGAFGSGDPTGSTEHDRHLAEAYSA